MEAGFRRLGAEFWEGSSKQCQSSANRLNPCPASRRAVPAGPVRRRRPQHQLPARCVPIDAQLPAPSCPREGIAAPASPESKEDTPGPAAYIGRPQHGHRPDIHRILNHHDVQRCYQIPSAFTEGNGRVQGGAFQIQRPCFRLPGGRPCGTFPFQKHHLRAAA